MDGELDSALTVADQEKPGAAEAIAALKGLGIRPVMLTGDNAEAASSWA